MRVQSCFCCHLFAGCLLVLYIWEPHEKKVFHLTGLLHLISVSDPFEPSIDSVVNSFHAKFFCDF